MDANIYTSIYYIITLKRVFTPFVSYLGSEKEKGGGGVLFLRREGKRGPCPFFSFVFLVSLGGSEGNREGKWVAVSIWGSIEGGLGSSSWWLGAI